ncbi:molybdopterin-guanine dinucleotide biosynthesis protein B [Roseinatronobacter bogoriensis]|uniref:Molybdopterin-guanine dinucleotide biosynthesis protein B n=1 Tax=Roseinatronobacter bogoriensis subsp. barguzinensis TaxID=441209 RepID=A0A2K8K669_9RHOB|nr:MULTISPECIES: molybdopterin-guanine dinucleotide biosynthesis protein B [Rhodobaca]ATX64426.1 molybdopterin-guanine dinucleotide biosynthesis protein B [Rhodobaca barguzinensis]MBB4209128.1 molybdopterin-guanine dinucleotide biosynthesis protein MobB [Rhodobaca bogoriensis DSM 18756]TDW36344.1 molybdopterin guanine dinucleotide biosynthesis accessory protein MobB [Rhodobaca barguzinensis]TDY67528.1 molybdopterin guanine dinucleotide biosynthesis accessory protein MobB [Rhodobaca bogoriensis 
MNLYGVTGWKNTGKTGLMERLVAEMVARGLTVSTVKHAHHDTEIDHPGRDSYRHRVAGAREVVLSSPRRWAVMHELRDRPEPMLAELLTRLSPVDLVLVEGYKRANHPKVEAYRAETGRDLLARENGTIRAVAADIAIDDLAQPVFHLDDTSAIADFILRDLGLRA